MKKQHTFWIYIFIVAVLILLVWICFSTPSSEASPVPCGVGPGFFGAVEQSGSSSGKPKVVGSNPACSIFASRSASAVSTHSKVKETAIIKKAADRNGCYGDDFLILLAIRKAENGRKGCEFGVEGKAWGTDLDTQAGWAAATVVKNRGRWERQGCPVDFIKYLGRRYCPLNSKVWEKNVRFWFERFNR